MNFLAEDHKFDLYYNQGDFTKHDFKTADVSVYDQMGKRIWYVQADTASNTQSEGWSFYNLKGRYLNIKGSSIKFSGGLGLFDVANENLSLSDNVSARSSLGYNFKTEKLELSKRKFKSNQKGSNKNEKALSAEGSNSEDVMISTDDEVRLFDDQDDLSVRAVGMLGNINTGVVNLLSDVWCQKKSNLDSKQEDSTTDKGGAIIESDKAIIKSGLRSIRFFENLKVSQDKFKIKGDEASFYVDEASGEIDSIRVRGNIYGTDGIKTALSERVDIKLKEDAIIFQGSPRIRVDENEMVGEEILITNNQQNIQVIRGNIKSTDDILDQIDSEDKEDKKGE